MSTAEDAFGVFTHGREGEEAGIGQGSEYRSGLLCFWKNMYFVCTYAEGESEASESTILSLGKYVAEAIKETGPKPEILDYLPHKGLVENTLRFFHTHVSLNYHYFLADSNILNLDEKTDAVLARYDKPEGKSLLLLVKYTDEEQARAARDHFAEEYIPEAGQTHICQTEDGTWVAVKVERDLIAVVFDAASSDQAMTLLNAVMSLE